MTFIKKILALILLVHLTCIHTIMGCTTFLLKKNGQMVFGRNYDWVTGTGVVNTNQRGLMKHSLPIETANTLQWAAKYGSITFNQYGKEFPNGGMNEKGLVVELMWLDESTYPAPDDRPAFTVLQWIQYQLDNCATVDEVIATDKKIRIISAGAPQHYLVADSKGNAATIEFLNGKMVVHSGKSLPYPVLANSTYEASLQSLKTTASKSAEPGFQANSDDRFSNACAMLQHYNTANTNKPIVDYSFDILHKVAQGDFTKWSIVYDISNLSIHFKTFGYQQVKTFNMAAFDLACTATPLAFNMNQNITESIDKSFKPYTHEFNAKMLKQAFSESAGEIHIDERLQQAAVAFPATVKCS